MKLSAYQYQYDSITAAAANDDNPTSNLASKDNTKATATANAAAPAKKMTSKLLLVASLAILGFFASLLVVVFSSQVSPEGESKSLLDLLRQKTATSSKSHSTKLALPQGVNFGSWLSLEDYFYVGETGATEVATPDENTAAVCLPPLHVGQSGAPHWQSETDLLSNLLKSTSVAKALNIFHAHRTSFITEYDLEQLSNLGITQVRVPLSWCFTDYDPDTDITDDVSDEQLLEQFTCPDPYYQDEHVRWPAVPRKLVAEFLRSCTKYGIKASLDLHTYPGATSPGTFSGLWPRQPRFWKYDDPSNPDEDYGRTLFRNFVQWVETLDRRALDGILGIGPMNEPAHLAGVFYNIPERNYLPPLSNDLAQSYLDELNSDGYPFPDGPHLRVLLWLRDAVRVFRDSTLPRYGIQLHVNLHESFLIEDLVPGNHGDEGGRGNPASHKLIAAWWARTTHHHERKHWAVLDIHHYHAWSPSCAGAVDGPPAGNYSCHDVSGRTKALERCVEWAKDIYRAAVDEMCGKGAKLMSGEFSASTHHRVRHACNDIDTLKATYEMQMAAAKDADVEMYYWSYKMPHGGAFRSAWSFTELMYLLGVTDRPDHENIHCGGHIPHEGEVNDDMFS